MKHYILLGTLLITLFSSCDKTENVTVEYPYILDEEFLSNELGWFEEDTSKNTQDKYFQKIIPNGNGLYAVAYFSSFQVPLFAQAKAEGGLNHRKNYILESSLTFDNYSYYPAGADNNTTVPCGIMWDITDDQNYFKVGVGFNEINKKAALHVQRIKNNVATPIIEPIEFEATTQTFEIKIEKTTDTDTFNSINLWVNGINITSIDSLVFRGNSQIGINSAKGAAVNYHNLRVRQEP